MLEAFKVFARKGGQDIEIGVAKTKREAAKILKKQLKGTLRAGGFVEKEGRRVDVGEFFGGREFRRGKTDFTRIIQKRGKRLGARSEVSEIQFFKRTGGSQKKKKKTGWF
jgi:hypothetical protein